MKKYNSLEEYNEACSFFNQMLHEGSMSQPEWKRNFEKLAEEFIYDYKKFPLEAKLSNVLARAVVFFPEDQKISLIEYIWNKIKDSTDLETQQRFAGILNVVANHFEDKSIKSIVKINKDQYKGKYSICFVDFIRRYSV